MGDDGNLNARLAQDAGGVEGLVAKLKFAGMRQCRSDRHRNMLSRKKLRCETLGTRFSLISDPKSYDRMNVSFARDIYRGTVLIVNRGFNKLFEMSDHDLNEAFVWLMRHRV